MHWLAPALYPCSSCPATNLSVVASPLEPERASGAELCATGSAQGGYRRRAAVLGLGNSPVGLRGRRASAAGQRCNVPRCASQPRLSALLWCDRGGPDVRTSHQSGPADAHRSPAHSHNAPTQLCALGRASASPSLGCARCARHPARAIKPREASATATATMQAARPFN